jgi:hypothetical protein
MLKFRIDVRVKEQIRARCPKHPKFDPSLDLRLNSEPRCSTCSDIRLLHSSRLELEEAVRAFDRRAFQWRVSRLARSQGGTHPTEPS